MNWERGGRQRRLRCEGAAREGGVAAASLAAGQNGNTKEAASSPHGAAAFVFQFRLRWALSFFRAHRVDELSANLVFLSRSGPPLGLPAAKPLFRLHVRRLAQH